MKRVKKSETGLPRVSKGVFLGEKEESGGQGSGFIFILREAERPLLVSFRQSYLFPQERVETSAQSYPLPRERVETSAQSLLPFLRRE